jgi:hypothetical protein
MFTTEELATMLKTMEAAEHALRYDNIVESYTDQGNIILSLNAEQFEALKSAIDKIHDMI